MARHTTKEIMTEYTKLTSLHAVYGRSVYEAGTCRCKGKLKKMGGGVDKKTGYVQAVYDKCEKCGKVRPR